MALRHYEGSGLRVADAAWACPTCGAPNTGPLEKGCTACGVGADGKKIGEASTLVAPSAGLATDLRDAFDEWYGAAVNDMAKQTKAEIARQAFEAGASWALDGLAAQTPLAAPAPAPAPAATGSSIPTVIGGGFLMALIHPSTHEHAVVDTRTQDTIRAALAFYRDNQLAYGVIPGQLAAAEVDALIAQLSPTVDTEQEIPF